MSDDLGGLFFFHLSFFLLIVIFISSQERIREVVAPPMAKKTFQHLILNNYVQTSSSRLSLEEEGLTCKTTETL